MNKWEEIFREANRLRAEAIRLDSAGLHAAADLKMLEFQQEVRRADAESRAAAQHPAAQPPRVRFSLTLELGGRSS